MPRAGLTETRVVEEGARIADEVGLSSLTLAAVAERLGVRQPSLYKHVAGTDGSGGASPSEPRSSWRRCCAARPSVAPAATPSPRWHWRIAPGQGHPGRYAAAQRAPVRGDADDEVASAEVVQVAFDVMAGYNLRDDDAVDAIRGCVLRSTAS